MIDWNRVRDLREEIGEEDFDEVAEMFIEEVEEVIGKLRTAPVAADLEADLHFLKSSALNIGFSEFAQLCSSGEANASAGGIVELAPILSSYDSSKAVFANGSP